MPWYSEFSNGLLDHTYVSLGIQYYLLARVGSRYPFNPSTGNLYHLAFELLFKSYLKNSHTSTELQNNYGHNLVKLWNEFKMQSNAISLERIDLLIKSLDVWEKVRYIELKGGIHAHAIEIVKGSASDEYLEEVKKDNFHTSGYFRIHTDDMDLLFYTFFSTLNVTKESLLNHPDFRNAASLYTFENKYNLISE